jgi:DNA-directed RNA polymerase subunit K
MEKVKEQFTKYEVARILGARGLQIAMSAPLLIKLGKEDLENIKYDPIEIARTEFESGVLPITVKRPLPRKIEKKLKREAVIVSKEKAELEEKKVEKVEKEEEKAVMEKGEIMELVKPEDEVEEGERREEQGI